MVVTQAQLLAWLGLFIWPFARVSGLLLTAPIIGSNYIPAKVRIAVAAAIAIAVGYSLRTAPPVPGHIGEVMAMCAMNVTYGALLGFVMLIAVSTIAVAGEMMGLSMGLSFAQLSSPANGTPMPVMSEIMLWAGMMAYLAAGGPWWLLTALHQSFVTDPTAVIRLGSWHALALQGTHLFSEGLWLALPVVIAGLAVNTILGVVTAFAPSLNIFSVGFPMLYLGGVWLLMVTSGEIQGVFNVALSRSIHFISGAL